MFLQKRFHPIHIALCLNDKACVSARNMENFRIQLSEQLRKAVLILFFEHVFFRKENLYFSPQIRKIPFLERRIVLSVFAGTSFNKRRNIGVEKRSFRMSLT